MNTPSSTSHLIITGYNVFTRAIAYLETEENHFLCHAVGHAIADIFYENGYERSLNGIHGFRLSEEAITIVKKFTDLIYEYFMDEVNGNPTFINDYRVGYQPPIWNFRQYTERLIAATCLAEICKEKQIKVYVKRDGLKETELSSFLKAFNWIEENHSAHTCIILKEVGGEYKEKEFYQKVFGIRCNDTFLSMCYKLDGDCSTTDIKELRLMALAMAHTLYQDEIFKTQLNES